MVLQLGKQSSNEGGNGCEEVCLVAPNGRPVVLTECLTIGHQEPAKSPVSTEKQRLLDGIVQVVQQVQRKDDHRKEGPRMGEVQRLDAVQQRVGQLENGHRADHRRSASAGCQ